MTEEVDAQGFAEDVETSRRFERGLLWRELVAVVAVAAIVVLRQVWGV